MKLEIDKSERRILRGLIEDVSGDIVIKLDCRGFIVQSSANIAEIGLDLSAALLPPHITDVVACDYAAFVGRHVNAALAGRATEGWAEFPLAGSTAADPGNQPSDSVWYALSLRPTHDASGAIEGALGLIRSVQHLRSLEGELHACMAKDLVTDLANRQTFCAMLGHHLEQGGEHSLVVFAVNGLRALELRYGLRTADEFIWAFARFLEAVAQPGCIIGRLDGERFGALCPDMTLSAARAWSQETVETFRALTSSSPAKLARLSVSAGLAPIKLTAEQSLRQAELGVILARVHDGREVGIAVPCRAA
jgi:diguanylate cyclase